ALVAADDRVLPQSEPAIVRCILDSLATAYASATDATVALAGRAIDVVHLLGGGSRNELLCQLTADATNRVVLAGPAEATALGNLLVQARARGAVPDDLDQLRRETADQEDLVRYRPGEDRPWGRST